MKLSLEPLTLDLGTTPIENMFFNTYLTLADGDAIKLYLYGFKLAYDQSTLELSNAFFARELGLSEEAVETAWVYWEEEGLVQRTEEGFIFKSLRQLYFENTQQGPDSLVNEAENRIQRMYQDIESVMGLNLTPVELHRIREAVVELEVEPELCAEAFRFSSEKYGKRNVNYVLGILRNWSIDGIRTMIQYRAQQEREKPKRASTRRKSTSSVMAGSHNQSKEDFEALLKKKLARDLKGRRKEVGEEGQA